MVRQAAGESELFLGWLAHSSAGTYFLDQPEISAALLEDKVTALKAGQARYLATSNVGCALHIASGSREAGMEIEVIHPVTLIARQMGMPFLK